MAIRAFARGILNFKSPFLLLIVLITCLGSYNSGLAQKTKLPVNWAGKTAAFVTIPGSIIPDFNPNTLDLELFKVKLEGRTEEIFGSKQLINGREVRFTPLWSFSTSLKYNVYYRNMWLGSFMPEPPQDLKEPKLLGIYPSSFYLPENLLKIYLHFDSPMSAGNVYSHIRIYQDDEEMLNTFLKLENELWNEDQTILTLWLDPGRIKRDLIPNQELGSPLQAGSSYTLVIQNTWESVSGLSLGRDYTKVFETTDADRAKPDYQVWEISPPRSGSRDPLVIDFGEPMDYLLTSGAIYVYMDGTFMAGEVSIGKNEAQLEYFPSESWKVGEYEIRIESRLEDLAGNNLNRLFDSDSAIDSYNEGWRDFYSLQFEIKNSN